MVVFVQCLSLQYLHLRPQKIQAFEVFWSFPMLCIFPFLEEGYKWDREGFCSTVKSRSWEVSNSLAGSPSTTASPAGIYIHWVSPEIPWICPLAPRTWCLQRLLWNSPYPRVRWASRHLLLTPWNLEKSLIFFNKEQMFLKTLPLLLVTFLAVCMDLCSGMQCSEPQCWEFCVFVFIWSHPHQRALEM